MAQLSNDCFAGPNALMRLDEALALLRQRLVPLQRTIPRPLAECMDHFLAQDILSPIQVPGRANAAVDGYLVYFRDINPAGETCLKVVGKASAGHPYLGPFPARSALRVLTGAILPEGPDTIYMQEDCRLEGEYVFLPPGIRRGANLRLAGEDVAMGASILGRGQRLRPQDLALASAVGLESLPLLSPLRISIFSTGDELAIDRQRLGEGQIYDSNRTLLSLYLTRLGMEVRDMGILPDRYDIIAQNLKEAAQQSDLILTSGGVSTGDEDHVRNALAAIGKIHLWRLAIKPGRPVALGQIDHAEGSVPFAGLPGNPVAAFVNLVHVVRPMILLLMGIDPELHPLPRFTGIADFSWKKKPGRREWLRVTLTSLKEDGLARLSLFPREGAGILSSLVQSDGLAEIPEDLQKIEAGDKIHYLPYWGMW